MRLSIFFHRLTRWAGAAAAVAATSLLSGCLWLDGPQSTFDPEGPVAREQLNIFYIICKVTLVIFVVVGAVLVATCFPNRTREAELLADYRRMDTAVGAPNA